MLDMLQLEQRVSQLTNISFDQLLSELDSLDPGDLEERYAEVCDGYMVLSLNGHRSHEQDLLLDKLDSSLRMLFGDKGLFVQAGRLLSIVKISAACGDVFRKQYGDVKQLLLVQEAMTRCAVLSKGGLTGPLPIDAATIENHAGTVGIAAASLLSIRTDSGAVCGFSSTRTVQRALARLLRQLAAKDTGSGTLDVINDLISGPLPARDKIRFLTDCHRMTGWSSCLTMALVAKERLEDIAGLVREGLGA